MTHSAKPVALVTGGSRGIGLGVATHLAKAGFNVAINGRRDPSDVWATVKALEAHGSEVLYCQADVSSKEDHQKMVNDILSRWGRLDALVNNAGVAPDVRADILEATPESFDRLISINLKGPYFLTQLVANTMIARKKNDPTFRGKIINVSSISATVASVNRGDYCISKAGVAMASKLWAVRLGEFGIDVYEVRPGVIATDMTGAVKEKYDNLIANGLTIDKRWGTPDDVGSAVTSLAKGDFPYATGSVIMVDGGLTLDRL